MMEIALGLLFLVGSLENSRAAYWAAGIWALTGGVILIGDALLIRRRLRSQRQAYPLAPETTPSTSDTPVTTPQRKDSR